MITLLGVQGLLVRVEEEAADRWAARIRASSFEARSGGFRSLARVAVSRGSQTE